MPGSLVAPQKRKSTALKETASKASTCQSYSIDELLTLWPLAGTLKPAEAGFDYSFKIPTNGKTPQDTYRLLGEEARNFSELARAFVIQAYQGGVDLKQIPDMFFQLKHSLHEFMTNAFYYGILRIDSNKREESVSKPQDFSQVLEAALNSTPDVYLREVQIKLRFNNNQLTIEYSQPTKFDFEGYWKRVQEGELPAETLLHMRGIIIMQLAFERATSSFDEKTGRQTIILSKNYSPSSNKSF